ncbi:hypothetical protein AWB69_08670 [Caballeronia udeis]|uniref:Uncharacterized protein n=1 Tax=Caballeronia udeis TaxID=1232866 RepID=A0A158JS76_9BURK|nr:hypothetical protein AWB69_08670 [Caballeronia udeis]
MSTTHHEQLRLQAARRANEEDASLWRWFCGLYEEGRIRWRKAAEGWLVSVDHKHLATEMEFDAAIRVARQRYFSGGRQSLSNSSRVLKDEMGPGLAAESRENRRCPD